MELQTIHNSMVNGNKKQMVRQIDKYGTYDFFYDYGYYLQELYELDAQLEHFQAITISYFIIKGR